MTLGRKIYWTSVAVTYTGMGVALVAGHFYTKGYEAAVAHMKKRTAKQEAIVELMKEASKDASLDAVPNNVTTLHPAAATV